MSENIPNKKIYGMVISYNSAPVLEDLYKRIDHKNFDKMRKHRRNPYFNYDIQQSVATPHCLQCISKACHML